MQYQARIVSKLCAIVALALWISGCASSGTIQKLNDAEIASLSSKNKIVVLNFWATWCQPCVEEIPIFVRLQQQYPEIDVVGVSMDEPDQTAAVEKFTQKHGMNYKVFLRQGENFETMVNSIDPAWMGGLPATFVFKDNKRTFSKAGLITEQELQQAIQ